MRRRDRSRTGRSRGRPGATSSRLAWLIVLLLVAGVGLWIYLHRRAGRSRARAVASACGAPLPNLHGGAVVMAKSARFLTVEQLLRLPAPKATQVYRVQARLLEYSADGQQYRIRLGSLVTPGLTVAAFLPAGSCASNRDDGALYDELREDLGLQFGPVTMQVVALPQPPQVVVTGIASQGPDGLELRPVLDLRVQ